MNQRAKDQYRLSLLQTHAQTHTHHTQTLIQWNGESMIERPTTFFVSTHTRKHACTLCETVCLCEMRCVGQKKGLQG